MKKGFTDARPPPPRPLPHWTWLHVVSSQIHWVTSRPVAFRTELTYFICKKLNSISGFADHIASRTVAYLYLASRQPTINFRYQSNHIFLNAALEDNIIVREPVNKSPWEMIEYPIYLIENCSQNHSVYSTPICITVYITPGQAWHMYHQGMQEHWCYTNQSSIVVISSLI